MKRLFPVLLLFAAACGGIYGSNVGEPSTGEKQRFREALERVREGMTEDSLRLLFEDADEAGEAGILRRTELNLETQRRVTYRLGWKSEPRHQGSYKRPEDIDQLLAVVELRDGVVTRITRVSPDG